MVEQGKAGGKTILRGAALGVMVLAMSACAPIYRNHGFVPAQSELSALEPGVDTRNSVTEAIGQPTAGGVLEGNAMYYVASRFRHIGPLQPQEIERQIVALNFDDGGVLRNIERYGLSDGRVVPLDRRVTDDGLRDTTFLRQLFGNVGNIDAGRFLGGDE